MRSELEQLIDRMISQGILFEEAVREFEKCFILNVVKRHHHNHSKAAAALGIHRNTLSKRLDDYRNGASSNGHERRQVAPRRKNGS
jgi:transcriptional regulator with PAS, ATPase and Fis domain